ncbi:MAG: class I SAM-dependent methyltransferase [Acidimicrobiia bacterium]|nr:class I SAM-dependent methyltransferase [Acidimicrobiia bacterium]
MTDPLDEHRAANRANWDDRVAIHWEPDGYDAPGFTADPDRISGVVQRDRAVVGDVTGQRLLHLQCHFGMDTLSWARLGADVTGVDFSERAIEAARRLSEESGTPARFVLSELYAAAEALPGETFDVVYTGVGAINWLPDIAGWAEVVAGFVAPGGRFYIREGHPVIWTLDWDVTDELVARYPYFETDEPVGMDEDVTYAGSGTVDHTRTYEWNHGIGEIHAALTAAGLRVVSLTEHRELEWQGHPMMVEGDDGRWRLPASHADRVPLMFSILAERA